MSKIRKLARWGGGILIAISSIAAGLYFTPFAHDHPDAVLKVLVGSAIGALLLGAFWMLTTKEKELKVEPKSESEIKTDTQENRVGRDNKGTQLNARDASFIGNDALKILSSSEPPAPQSDPPLVLQFLKSKSIPTVLEFQNKRWIKTSNTSNADLAMVLYVENPLTRPGEKPNPCAREIAAHLKFTGDVGNRESVAERAYWVDEVMNNVDIKPGTSKAIVLGTFRGGLWRVFSNQIEDRPARITRQTLRSGAYWSSAPPNFVDLVACNHAFSIEVTVFVIDGRPILHETFQVKRIENENKSSFLLWDGK